MPVLRQMPISVRVSARIIMVSVIIKPRATATVIDVIRRIMLANDERPSTDQLRNDVTIARRDIFQCLKHVIGRAAHPLEPFTGQA